MLFPAVVVGLGFVMIVVGLVVEVVVPPMTTTQTFTSAHMPEQLLRTVRFCLATLA